MSPVDVEMVGVHGGDGRYRRTQLQERAVEFVGFSNDCLGMAHQEVGPVVVGYSTQEGRAAILALRKNMGDECAGSGLSVGTGHREAGLSFGKLAQHPGPFHNGIAMFPDIHQLLQVFRNGRSIDHQGGSHVFRDIVHIVRVMDVDPFLLEGMGQV